MQRATKFKAAIFGGAGVVVVGGAAVFAATQTDLFSSDDDEPQAIVTEEPSATVATPSAEPTPEEEPEPEVTEALTEEELAIEAAEIMSTWHAAEDFNQTTAEFRAAHLMTEERAAQIVEPERPATGAVWAEAAERDAVSEPTGQIMDRTNSDVLTVRVTWRWVAEGYNPLSDDTVRNFYFTIDQDDEGNPIIHDYTWETQ